MPTARSNGASPDLGLLQGTLDVMILKALSWGPMHGFAVAKWIRLTTDDVLQIGTGDDREYAVVDTITGTDTITLKSGLTNARLGPLDSGGNPQTPSALAIAVFTSVHATKLDGAVATNANAFQVEDPIGFAADAVVEFAGATPGEKEYRVIDPVGFIRLGDGVGNTHAAGATVKVAATNPVPARKLTADTVAGSKDIVLNDVSGLAGNALLRLGDEIVIVNTVLGHTVTLTSPR